MRRHVVLLWVTIVTSAGCPDDGAAAGDAESSSTAGREVPFVRVGSTVDAGDDVDSPCGGVGSPDVEIAWTAPVASNYVISTKGSGFDTVVSVFADDGGGELLACNDDAELTVAGRSEVVLALAADTAVLVVVDGVLRHAGDYTLAITDLGAYARNR
jgi:hypothetical protein